MSRCLSCESFSQSFSNKHTLCRDIATPLQKLGLTPVSLFSSKNINVLENSNGTKGEGAIFQQYKNTLYISTHMHTDTYAYLVTHTQASRHVYTLTHRHITKKNNLCSIFWKKSRESLFDEGMTQSGFQGW